MAELTPPTRRHWFRFSLWTLFLVITVIAIPLGWICNQVSWIWQRQRFLEEEWAKANALQGTSDPRTSFGGWLAPRSLRLFGQQGECVVLLILEGPSPSALTESDQKRLQVAKSLFPESGITGYHFDREDPDKCWSETLNEPDMELAPNIRGLRRRPR